MSSSAPTPAEANADEVVAEADFAALLRDESRPLFAVLRSFEGIGADRLGRPYFAGLLHERHELESFLDDHGARLNRRFATYTEIVASLRAFAMSGYALAHLASRIDSYGRERWTLSRPSVDAGLASARAFVQQSTTALGAQLGREAEGVGFDPSDALGEPRIVFERRRVRLPHDIAEDLASDGDQRVAELVSRYIQAADMLSELEVQAIDEPERRRSYVRECCREEQARVYEATVHNLQSTYDTYVKNTALESGDARLPALRGHASAALHLLEAVTQLAHFHERHESDLGSARAAALLAEIVDPDRVQEVLINDLFSVAASTVLQEGRTVAEVLLSEYTHVRELFVELPAGVVLHARPVALIVGIVAHFGTPVEVEIGAKRCNAGSILEVLMALGGAPGAASFVFRGDERPLEHIALLFEHDLGEGKRSDLPRELGYLRAT